MTEEKRGKTIDAFQRMFSEVKDAYQANLAAILALIQGDPHSWSTRPCSTCQAVSSIAGTAFGCVKHRADREGGKL